MNTKWSPQEDERLFNAIKKHGTQWNLIMKQTGSFRSQNALIKRWHSHLKQKVNLQEIQSINKKVYQEEPQKQAEKQLVQEQSEKVSNEEESDAQKEKINHQIIKTIQNEQFDWKYRWCEEQEARLKQFIVYDSIFEWEKLADHFGIPSDEIKARWIKIIYPKIKNSLKIGGAVKWSSSEDSILYGADKSKVSYLDLMFFLPGRTVYSIEARWRRTVKNTDAIDHMTVLHQRHNKRKQLLSKINLNIKMQKQAQMQKVYEIEKINFLKQKAQMSKFEMMKRSEKAKKEYKI